MRPNGDVQGAAAAATGAHCRRVSTAAELEAVRALFRAYAEEQAYGICFQGFEAELAGLPQPYAPPGGCLLLAAADGGTAGCAALQPLDGEAAELKRLYVAQGARGRGLGRVLTEAALAEARALGYAQVRLETLPSMAAAQALYAGLGFRRCPPYRTGTDPRVLCMEMALGSAAD